MAHALSGARTSGPICRASTATPRRPARARYPAGPPAARGCLHAATVRAPFACARLARHRRRARALATPGVVRVLTAADVRGTNRFGLLEADQPVLVEDRDPRRLGRGRAGGGDERAGGARGRAAGRGSSSRASAPLVDPGAGLRAGRARRPSRARATAAARHPNVVAERDDPPRRRRARARARRPSSSRASTARAGSSTRSSPRKPGSPSPTPTARLTLHVATQWPEAGSAPGGARARRAARAPAHRPADDRRRLRRPRGRLAADSPAARRPRDRAGRCAWCGIAPSRSAATASAIRFASAIALAADARGRFDGGAHRRSSSTPAATRARRRRARQRAVPGVRPVRHARRARVAAAPSTPTTRTPAPFAASA